DPLRQPQQPSGGGVYPRHRSDQHRDRRRTGARNGVAAWRRIAGSLRVRLVAQGQCRRSSAGFLLTAGDPASSAGPSPAAPLRPRVAPVLALFCTAACDQAVYGSTLLSSSTLSLTRRSPTAHALHL